MAAGFVEAQPDTTRNPTNPTIINRRIDSSTGKDRLFKAIMANARTRFAPAGRGDYRSDLVAPIERNSRTVVLIGAGRRALSIPFSTTDAGKRPAIRLHAVENYVAVDPATHAVWTTYTDGKSSYAKFWVPPHP